MGIRTPGSYVTWHGGLVLQDGGDLRITVAWGMAATVSRDIGGDVRMCSTVLVVNIYNFPTYICAYG